MGKGGGYNPPAVAKTTSYYRKQSQGVRKRYFIDKYAILSQLKHFCGNGANRIFTGAFGEINITGAFGDIRTFCKINEWKISNETCPCRFFSLKMFIWEDK